MTTDLPATDDRLYTGRFFQVWFNGYDNMERARQKNETRYTGLAAVVSFCFSPGFIWIIIINAAGKNVKHQ